MEIVASNSFPPTPTRSNVCACISPIFKTKPCSCMYELTPLFFYVFWEAGNAFGKCITLSEPPVLCNSTRRAACHLEYMPMLLQKKKKKSVDPKALCSFTANFEWVRHFGLGVWGWASVSVVSFTWWHAHMNQSQKPPWELSVESADSSPPAKHRDELVNKAEGLCSRLWDTRAKRPWENSGGCANLPVTCVL